MKPIIEYVLERYYQWQLMLQLKAACDVKPYHLFSAWPGAIVDELKASNENLSAALDALLTELDEQPVEGFTAEFEHYVASLQKVDDSTYTITLTGAIEDTLTIKKEVTL